MKRYNFKKFIALILAVAMLLPGVPYSNVKANAAETAVAVGQEIDLPGGLIGTVSGVAEMIPANIKLEDNDTDLIFAEEQPEDGVKLVVNSGNGHGGKVRDRIQNFNGGEGVVITEGTQFYLEYEASADFDLTKLSLEGTNSANGWTVKNKFSSIGISNGVAVYTVSASSDAEDKLYDIRIKADAGKLPDGSTLTIKKAYFVSDLKSAPAENPPVYEGIQLGEKRTAGKIRGTVVAFSEPDKDNYYVESGNFKYAEEQPEDGVRFAYPGTGSIRNRIKNFTTAEAATGAAVSISSDIRFVIEYESTGNFSFSQLTIQGTKADDGWDNDFEFSVLNESDGAAVFSVAAKTESSDLYNVRLKGDSVNYTEGTTLTIKNAYFLTDIEEVTEPVDPVDPVDPAEGFVVGAKKKVGKIEGTISGIVKADATNMIMESGQPDMNPAAEQPEGGVKFEKTADGSKIRNRFYVNEKDGAGIAEGDKFVIEYEASGDFDLSMLHFWPQIVADGGYEDIAELSVDEIKDGLAVYSVPANYKDGKIYSIRIKDNGADIVPRGAWVTFKDVYFLTDVKAASTEIDPNANPVGQEYAVGDLSGTISGYVKLNKDNIFVESGCDLAIPAAQPEVGFKLEKASKAKIRNRYYINEGNGVVLKKGDKLIIDRELINDLELENIGLQPQVTGKDAFEDTPYLSYVNTIDGKAIFNIPDSLEGNTLYALRGKAEKETDDNVYVTEGSAIIIKGMYILTDVVDNSEPAKPACPYEISANVQGIAVTYYNDIFSRGVAWRTSNNEATDSVLQVINKNDVEDISEFWWDTDKVVTIPDYFCKSFTNSSKDATVYTCHKAHIENLLDKNVYYYRVGSETSGWSRPGTMTIDSELDDFTFIHVTDPQATSESEYRQFENLLREAYKKLGKTGSTHVGTIDTGDITNECHDGKVFIDEFNMSQDFDADDLMNTVIVPVAGNHDVTEDIFWSMYDIDFQDYCTDGKHNTHRTGACYSYQVGNVFLLGSNSNESGNLDSHPANGEYDSKADYHEQYNWIVSQLEKAAQLREEGKIKWIVYLTHAGMMSVGYHTMDGGSRCLRANITPLLAKYKVDLVLQGHDHAYTRTVPYYYGKDLNGQQFSGYQSNERETFKGHGDVSYDNPFTPEIEYEGDRIWNVEPEGTHYITINYGGTKSLEISKDNAEARYQMPDQCILDGLAVSPINGIECGLKYAKQFFALIRFSGDVMTYDTYCFSGGKSDLFDTFTVIKDGNHEPDLDKKPVEFTGVYVESKEYDGKAARLEADDILAVIPGTEEEEIQFTDYDKIVYTVTGTLANGSQYYRTDKLPKEIGNYTLHITLSNASAFFKGETTIDFSITAKSAPIIISNKDYIGGLTAGTLPGGGRIEFEEIDVPAAPGGTGTVPIIIPPIVDDDEEPGDSGNTPGQVDIDNPGTPEGTPSEQVDIDNPETPEGAADEAEEIEAEYFSKDKEFTGKKLTGFDVEVEDVKSGEPKTVKVKVSSKKVGKAGKTLYLYKVDKENKKLLETIDTEIKVDADGYAEFTAYADGEYVLVSKKASSKTVVTLGDQISVKEKVSVKAGKTKKKAMGLVLPPELKGTKVTYSSSDKKIVKISKKGTVTAVKKGKAKITVKVTLPDGTVKKYVTTVTVK